MFIYNPFLVVPGVGGRLVYSSSNQGKYYEFILMFKNTSFVVSHNLETCNIMTQEYSLGYYPDYDPSDELVLVSLSEDKKLIVKNTEDGHRVTMVLTRNKDNKPIIYQINKQTWFYDDIVYSRIEHNGQHSLCEVDLEDELNIVQRIPCDEHGTFMIEKGEAVTINLEHFKPAIEDTCAVVVQTGNTTSLHYMSRYAETEYRTLFDHLNECTSLPYDLVNIVHSYVTRCTKRKCETEQKRSLKRQRVEESESWRDLSDKVFS